MKKANLLVTLIACLSAVSSFAATESFRPELCGKNGNGHLVGSNEVSLVFKGVYTAANGKSSDAFLIRYNNGKQETYITDHISVDSLLNTTFYDVRLMGVDANWSFLSFGMGAYHGTQDKGYLFGETYYGHLFSVNLVATDSLDHCGE